MKKKEEKIDRRRTGKTILWSEGKDFASSTRAAEDRTRWKGIVVKSSVVPQRPRNFTGYRLEWTYFICKLGLQLSDGLSFVSFKTI